MSNSFSGLPTEILIVGSQHIGAELPDAALEFTLERLTAWKPDMVALEILPGELVELYERQGGWLENLRYGGYPLARRLGARTQALTGWNRQEALLKIASSSLAPADRVMAYLVLREPWNALLHWSSELLLPADLSQELAELSANKSESVRLGVAIARALGHQKLCLFDDFPIFDLTDEQNREFAEGMQAPEFRLWMEQHPFMAAYEAAQEKSRLTGDYWPLLCELNSPEMVIQVGDLETGGNLRLGLVGRAKQADWDARNLFMAGRLRMAMGEHVGGKILAIVGQSHKGPLEAALRALGSDVRTVEFAELE